jgi:hypothetical protein
LGVLHRPVDDAGRLRRGLNWRAVSRDRTTIAFDSSEDPPHHWTTPCEDT